MNDTASPRRPNILLVMFDQLAPQSLPSYGHPVVKAPHLERLSAEGVLFENAYCNSPLCAPSRFSMMAGQLASRISAWDNAAEFPATIPTFAHYLRLAGYRTCLSGKMHFVGPDQLHGFEERVTTDMYPSDFGWTPEWDHPEKTQWWFHNMLSVAEAGPYDRSLEMDFDEEVAFHATRWIQDVARGSDRRPWLLAVSFMHPHDPFLAPREYWDKYDPAHIDLPTVPFIPVEKRDPLSRRMFELYDRGEYPISAKHVRAARHAYYAMITYADALMGQVLAALNTTGQAEDTIIVVTADHGEMLGERGLWYKMTFFERAVRVPLIIHAPMRFGQCRVKQNVSLVDLLPTLLELSGTTQEMAVPVDGRSLLPLATSRGGGWPDTVYAEYMAEGTTEPVFMIRRGRHKYICCAGDPSQLFDLEKDPLEVDNLAGKGEYRSLVAEFAEEAAGKWDGNALRASILNSQRQRILVQQALLTGRIHPWDHEPRQDAAQRYNRNYDSELYDTDRRARLPLHPEPPKNGKLR
jgi:choline-sulfatase